jgi:hypothetical protein
VRRVCAAMAAGSRARPALPPSPPSVNAQLSSTRTTHLHQFHAAPPTRGTPSSRVDQRVKWMNVTLELGRSCDERGSRGGGRRANARTRSAPAATVAEVEAADDDEATFSACGGCAGATSAMGHLARYLRDSIADQGASSALSHYAPPPATAEALRRRGCGLCDPAAMAAPTPAPAPAPAPATLHTCAGLELCLVSGVRLPGMWAHSPPPRA